MGGNHSSKSKVTFDDASDVNFDHFQILRAIGKGSFGKVCIVQKKDTQRMYAMKYMNKNHCVQKDAVRNVIREIEILTTLDHPFLVNLWFSFHDEEDMFMVVDLLLGGDLRYHMQQDVQFDDDCVKLYICEIALALDYLQYKNIIHRDIKPDNILLDEEGHVHITDFNIATVIQEGELATSMSGTKPYIAPEVFECAADACPGYSYPVDWWSLGICAYEMLKNKYREDHNVVHVVTSWLAILTRYSVYRIASVARAHRTMQTMLIKPLNRVHTPNATIRADTIRYDPKRPFDIHSGTNISEIREMFSNCKVQFLCPSGSPMNDVLRDLICVDPKKRISSLKQLRETPLMSSMDFDAVLQRKVKPSFVPAKDHLNCDPTFELEEMIIESKPLHKKKKRLSKQNSRREQMSVASANDLDPLHGQLCNIQEEFTVFNREKEMKRQELEKKEREWQEELERFMMYDTSGSSKKDKSHHSLNVRKVGDNKGNKKHSPQSNSKMISPTVTRRFPRSKRFSGDGKDGGSSSLHPREKEEIQKTLAEAGKLLAIGAVEPLVMLTTASTRTSSNVDAKQSQLKTPSSSIVHKK